MIKAENLKAEQAEEGKEKKAEIKGSGADLRGPKYTRGPNLDQLRQV